MMQRRAGGDANSSGQSIFMVMRVNPVEHDLFGLACLMFLRLKLWPGRAIMQQVPSTLSDRMLWGRMVDGYAKAWGTGCRRTDPKASEINTDGGIFLMMPLEEWQLREIWEGCGLNTTSQESTWHRLSDFEQRIVHLTGLKIQKGFWAGEVWTGCLSFLLDREQVNAGWIAAKDIQRLFENFDRWIDGKVRSLENVVVAAGSI